MHNPILNHRKVYVYATFAGTGEFLWLRYVQQAWCAISTLGLWLLSDLAHGYITNVELTLHSRETVLLAQPLRCHRRFLHQLHYMYPSNWELASVFISFLVIVQLLMQLIRCQFSISSIAYYWLLYSCTIINDLTSVFDVVPDIGIIGECLENITNNHSRSCRYIYPSDICNLLQQLGYTIYFDHTWCFQIWPRLGESYNYNSRVLHFNVPHVVGQFREFFQVTALISPPPFSQLGSCGISYPTVEQRYDSLLMHMFVCLCNKYL